MNGIVARWTVTLALYTVFAELMLTSFDRNAISIGTQKGIANSTMEIRGKWFNKVKFH